MTFMTYLTYMTSVTHMTIMASGNNPYICNSTNGYGKTS